MVAVAVGRRLGRYQLAEQIGHGGSATVYRARDAVTGRDVAIKVIAAGYAADSAFRARFRQEAELVSRLGHPHILRVLDSGDTDASASAVLPTPAAPGTVAERGERLERVLAGGTAYLVTEYMPGGSLAARLRVERGARERCLLALAVAEQIGAALEWAHAAGVLHRDVKPSNILVSHDGRYVLGDFGLARVLQEGASLHLTASGLVAGTPAYMAPEQALGQASDARTDIYGLAVVLYEILSGRVPFVAETPLAVMLAHVHQPPPSPRDLRADLPAAIVPVLERALAKEREARYQTPGEMAAALRAAVAEAYGESAIDTGLFPQTPSGPVPALAAALSGESDPLAAHPRREKRAARSRANVRLWPRTLRPAAAVAVALLALGSGGAAVVFGPGRGAVAHLLTRYVADSVPPGISDALPHHNARNVGLRPSITVYFTHPMDQPSVEAALRLDPWVPLEFDWAGQLLVATPQLDLEPSREYTLLIGRAARDAEGRPLGGDLVRRFTTVALAEVPKLPGSALAEPAPEPPRATATILQPSPTAPPVAPATPPPPAVLPATVLASQPTRYAPPTMVPMGPDQSLVAGLLLDAEGTPRGESLATASPSPERTATPAATATLPPPVYLGNVPIVMPTSVAAPSATPAGTATGTVPPGGTGTPGTPGTTATPGTPGEPSATPSVAGSTTPTTPTTPTTSTGATIGITPPALPTLTRSVAATPTPTPRPGSAASTATVTSTTPVAGVTAVATATNQPGG